jgi:hypothetical protein
MTTYKERKENQYSYVLLKNDDVLGTFGNLRKITEIVEDDNFPSYWTLVRKKEFPIEFMDYRIHKVKHY